MKNVVVKLHPSLILNGYAIFLYLLFADIFV